jgi:hypothetical protein
MFGARINPKSRRPTRKVLPTFSHSSRIRVSATISSALFPRRSAVIEEIRFPIVHVRHPSVVLNFP